MERKSGTEMIDRNKLRESLLHEQAKYMMSEHEQNRHTSAGFLLAVAELDSQPIIEAIPISRLKERVKELREESEKARTTVGAEYARNLNLMADAIETEIARWRKEK